MRLPVDGDSPVVVRQTNVVRIAIHVPGVELRVVHRDVRNTVNCSLQHACAGERLLVYRYRSVRRAGTEDDLLRVENRFVDGCIRGKDERIVRIKPGGRIVRSVRVVGVIASVASFIGKHGRLWVRIGPSFPGRPRNRELSEDFPFAFATNGGGEHLRPVAFRRAVVHDEVAVQQASRHAKLGRSAFEPLCGPRERTVRNRQVLAADHVVNDLVPDEHTLWICLHLAVYVDSKDWLAVVKPQGAVVVRWR